MIRSQSANLERAGKESHKKEKKGGWIQVNYPQFLIQKFIINITIQF